MLATALRLAADMLTDQSALLLVLLLLLLHADGTAAATASTAKAAFTAAGF
jgi:hypothetical protein